MKKRGRKGKQQPRKEEKINDLLAEYSTTEKKQLTEEFLKSFILYAFYYFNISDETKDLMSLYVSVQKKYGQAIREKCQAIVNINNNSDSRKKQNRTMGTKFPGYLNLQTSEETYKEVCELPDFGKMVITYLLKYKEGDSVDLMQKMGGSKSKRPLISVACILNCPALINRLQQMGAQVNYNEIARHPLVVSVVGNHIDAAKYLVAKVYTKEIKKSLHMPLLIAAASNANIDLLRILHEHKVVFLNELEHAKKNRSENPIFMLNVVKLVCRKGESEQLLDMLRYFCRLGYCVDGVDEHGSTTLSIAIDYKCYEVLHVLLTEAKQSAKRALNQVLMSGGTLLAKLVSYEKIKLIKICLSMGADPNNPGQKPHLHPFQIASRAKNKALIQLFDASKKDSADESLPLSGKLCDTLEVFMNRSIVYAITSGDLEAVKGFVKDGEAVSLYQYDLKSPIYYAMRKCVDTEDEELRENAIAILKYLLKHLPDFCGSIFHDQLFPPLHFCLINDHGFLVPLFVSDRKAITLATKVIGRPIDAGVSENAVDAVSALAKHVDSLFLDAEHFIDKVKQASARGHDKMVVKLFQYADTVKLSEYDKQVIFTQLIRCFSFSDKSEQVAHQNNFSLMLAAMGWYIGFPEELKEDFVQWNPTTIQIFNYQYNSELQSIEAAEAYDVLELKTARKTLEKMKPEIKHQKNIFKRVFECICAYSEFHGLGLKWKCERNLIIGVGKFDKQDPNILALLKLPILKSQLLKKKIVLKFGLPSKYFESKFEKVMLTEPWVKAVKDVEYPMGKLLMKFSETNSEKSDKKERVEVMPTCFNGCIDAHHEDVKPIKYTKDFVFLPKQILDILRCDEVLCNELWDTCQFGFLGGKIITRLNGQPIHTKVEMNECETSVRLTHRLTYVEPITDQVHSIALGAVLSDDKSCVFYVGLIYMPSLMLELHELAILSTLATANVINIDKLSEKNEM